MNKVDVIIPVYKPDEKFLRLLSMLSKQTMPIGHIIIYNTEESLFQAFYDSNQLEKKYDNLKIFHHTKEEFDHGGTRNKGVKESDAEVFVMMTMDAVPKDEFLIERLYRGLCAKEKIAVSYARQLADSDCREVERFIRCFNYPKESKVKDQRDTKELGIKTYFCSNVCAAYKRKIFDDLGGFVSHTIFNEDMIYAGGAVQNGYAISYVAEAEVIHSHNYTNRQQFQRNFDLGVSQTDHPEIFEGLKSESEGIRMVLKAQKHLVKTGHMLQVFRLYTSSAAKLLGYRMGKAYRKLPMWVIRKCTMSPNYWKV